MTWQKMKIGSFLKRKRDAIEIKDNIEYKRITIKTKHQGVYLRDNLKGSLIGTKLQFTVNAGQFLLSKIDARLGAFGIVPKELNGAIITGNFWTFDVDKEKVNIDWFNLFTSSGNFYEICNQASSGTTHRKYLDETKFLNFEIEIPNPDEQALFIQKYKSYYGIYNKLNVEIDKQQSYLQLLRQSILQEAVQGKLVPQDANEEPAEQLLQRIKAEKAQLIKEGKLKKEKELPPITEEEMPFELPLGWTFCRLGETGQINPRNIFDDNKEAAFIPMNLISSKFETNPQFEIRKWKDIKNGFTHFADNDVAVAKITPCFENSKAGVFKHLKNGIGAGTTELHVFRGNKKYILPDYVFLFFKSPNFLKEGENKMTGSAGQKRVPSEFIKNVIFPFPPHSEQQRITAKVKQLIQTVTHLEQQINECKSQAGELLQSVLKEAFTTPQELKATTKSLKKYKENEHLTMAAEE